MVDDVTVVVGIDEKTIQYLRVSCETWRLHRPEMWRMPWVLFYDTALPLSEVDQMIKQLDVSNLRPVAWPHPGGDRGAYETQRERMLSGHVWVPGMDVHTMWSMKIDCDVLATRRSEWLKPEWFEDLCDPADGECDANCEPIYIAPSWHYTKGVNFLGRLEEWGDAVDWGPHGVHPRLDIPFDPTALRVPHKRMCSWLSFYNVGWLNWLCGELEPTVGYGRLPVPSQDTTVWYAAERSRSGNHDKRSPGCYRHVNMKALGWTNVSKLPQLKEQAAMILKADQHQTMTDS